MNYEKGRAMLLAYCRDSYKSEKEMSANIKGEENTHKARKISSDARAVVYKELGELIYKFLPIEEGNN